MMAVIIWLYSKGKPMTEEAKKPSVHPVDTTNSERSTANTARILRLNEIELSVKLTKNQVLTKWGPPHAIEGFGVEYLVYKLEDGRLLWLLFASQSPQPLLKALIFADSSDTEGKTIFDGMNETKLR